MCRRPLELLQTLLKGNSLCLRLLQITACRKLAKKAERARYAPFMAGGSPHAGLPIGFAEFDAAGLQESGAMHAMQARCMSFTPLLSPEALGPLARGKFQSQPALAIVAGCALARWHPAHTHSGLPLMPG